MMESTTLSGMKAIQEHCRSINLPSSEATVIQMIHDSGFPARKLGGIWIASKVKIDEWFKEFTATGEPAEDKKPEKKKKKQPRRRW